jgi:ribonucleoside-diphosphate reductase alpha chain
VTDVASSTVDHATPALSRNAQQVLAARYLRRDRERHPVETPHEMFARVARAVAHAELLLGNAQQAAHWEGEFYDLLSSLRFLPNSPTLMNAGTRLGQLSACFVLPVGDTLQEIFDAVRDMALVQRTGGGTGFSFSQLRPAGDLLESTSGQASGPVSFMNVFNCATEHIKQGGKRRGANMGVLRVDHPDILDFVRAKKDETVLRNFNCSVLVTDAFMQAARAEDWYPLVHPRTGRQVARLRASDVLQEIVSAAWTTGDPGLLFGDAINRANPTPQLGAIEATNPCGEIPLLPYEACTLGSLNLVRFLRGPDAAPEVDWEALGSATRTAVRFLDDVVEVNVAPLPAIAERVGATRKIGLGVMGFAELLIRLGISYDSEAAVRLAERVMSAVEIAAGGASEALAAARGVFPAWRGSRYEVSGTRVRHATRTAIAPTGTISIIAGTSPSIEPLFALAYRRTHVLDEQTLPEVSPLLHEYLERHHATSEAMLAEALARGRLRNVPGVPAEVQRLFVTALEIPAERHLAIQAAFQRHTDNSVSKTINLPEEATPDDVAQAYRRAWELGLKGITIYRYGSKASQVLELGAAEEPYQRDHASVCDPEECRV